MNVSPMRQASALLPMAMSLAGLVLVLGHAAIFGVVHEADEGTAAHVFQLLMAAQGGTAPDPPVRSGLAAVSNNGRLQTTVLSCVQRTLGRMAE